MKRLDELPGENDGVFSIALWSVFQEEACINELQKGQVNNECVAFVQRDPFALRNAPENDSRFLIDSVNLETNVFGYAGEVEGQEYTLKTDGEMLLVQFEDCWFRVQHREEFNLF